MQNKKYINKLHIKLAFYKQEVSDLLNSLSIRIMHKWPCTDKKYLVVGVESSGTTAIANLLFIDIPGLRFLEEGNNQWVWDTYQSVYQKKKVIFDYPRLQLFDAIKVPGFATILHEVKTAFPNIKIVYIVRDPRDFINSAIKTWRLKTVEELSNISWCKEDWLSIKSEDPIERLSLRWKKYLNLAMEHSDVIYLRYEDFWNNKVETIATLSEKLEIPFNVDRVKRINNKQLCSESVRNYVPKGPGEWKNGMLRINHVRKIEDICKQEMLFWKYDLLRR